MRALRLAPLACLLGLACVQLACEPTPPGEVLLDLVWTERPAEPVWLSARIEERAPGAAPRLLGESEQVEVRPEAPIDLVLPEIPNGAHRVVFIDGRASDDPNANTIFGGVSTPFSVRAGVTTRVEVPLEIVAIDRDEEVQVALCFGDDCGTAPRTVRLAALQAAELRIDARAIASVRLSNDPAFIRGATRRVSMNSRACERVDEAAVRCAIPWDLTAGITSIEGGTHAVFLQFRDTNGYDLEPRRLDAIRDDRAPDWSRATVSPPVIRPEASARLTFNATEPLDLAATRLQVTGGRADALERVGESLSYTATITPAEGASSVQVRAELVDPVGNLRETAALAEPLRVDADPPVFEVLQAPPAQLDPRAQELSLQVDFAVDEANPIDEPPTVLFGDAPLDVTRTETGWTAGFTPETAPDLAEVQARWPVEARWRDRAGNAATATLGTVSIDGVAPRVVQLSLQPALAVEGQPMTLQVVADEPLAEARLLDPPPGFVAEGTLTPDRFAASWNATTGEEGPFSLVAALTDDAGNTRMTAPIDGRRDFTPIDLSATRFSVTYDGADRGRHAALGATVRVFVDLGEQAAEIVSATLGDRPMVEVDGGFEATVPVDATDGPMSVVVSARDPAGNQSRWVESILVDGTPPTGSLRLDWDQPARVPTHGNRLLTLPRTAFAELIIRTNEPADFQALVADRLVLEDGLEQDNRTVRVRIDPPPTDRNEAVVTALTDRAGNREVVEVGDLRWITTPPASRADRLRLVRAPWGSTTTESIPRSFFADVDYRGGPFNPAQHGADVPFGETIEIVAVDAAGDCDPDTVLIRQNNDQRDTLAAGVLGDLQRACAITYDWAGNASAAEPIRNGLWIATLGDAIANPHQLLATPRHDPWRVSDRGVSVAAGAARADGVLAAAEGAWVWWRIGGDLTPGVTDHLAIDPDLGRLMVVDTAEDGSAQQWSFRLAERAWTPAGPSLTTPGGRTDATVLFDRRRERLLLFGGLDGDALSDAWQWSSRTAQWTRLDDPVCGFAMGSAYDAARDQFVFHGGICRHQDLGTRVWDPVEDRLVTLDIEGPGPRFNHAMTYNPQDGVVLLHGGERALELDSVLGELWAFSDGVWVRWDGPNVGPGPLANHQMAWDQRQARLVLYSGVSDGEACPTVWQREARQAGRWTSVVPPPPCPGPGPLLWVDQLGRVVARDAEGLWRWEVEAGIADGRWQRMAPVFDERPLAGATSIQRDETNARLHLAEARVDGRLFTTAENGGAWRLTDQLPTRGPLGWSPQHGLLQEGADGMWQRRAPGDWQPFDLPPGVAGDPTALLVRTEGPQLLRLGDAGGQLSVWQLEDEWIPFPVDAPVPAPDGTAAAWLRPADGLLLLGSRQELPDPETQAWRYFVDDGWAPVSLAEDAPPPRGDARLTYVNLRQRLALFGGREYVPLIGGAPIPHADDLWEWDADGWQPTTRTRPWPDARRSQGMVYDADRQRLLMFGGVGPNGPLNDFWEAEMGSARPALRFDVSLAAARVPGAAREQLTMVFTAGGQAGLDTEGDRAPGARVQIWDGEDWLQRRTNIATDAAPAALTWTLAGDALRLTPIGAEEVVSAAVTPRGTNQRTAGRVVVDYVEARLLYALPAE